MTSLTGRGTEAFLNGEKTAVEDPIKVENPKDLERMLNLALQTSFEKGIQSLYHMIFNNCNIQCYKIIKKIKNKNSRATNRGIMRAWAEFHILISEMMVFSKSLPVFSRFGLSWRGWVDKQKKSTLMQNSQEFLQLSREYFKAKGLTKLSSKFLIKSEKKNYRFKRQNC